MSPRSDGMKSPLPHTHRHAQSSKSTQARACHSPAHALTHRFCDGPVSDTLTALTTTEAERPPPPPPPLAPPCIHAVFSREALARIPHLFCPLLPPLEDGNEDEGQEQKKKKKHKTGGEDDVRGQSVLSKGGIFTCSTHLCSVSPGLHI